VIASARAFLRKWLAKMPEEKRMAALAAMLGEG
jgi:hypothetical protein